jgi:hypothetical protein
MTVLVAYAESDERVDRAIEVISRYSPVNIDDYYTFRQSPSPRGAKDTAFAPVEPSPIENSSNRKLDTSRHARVFRYHEAAAGMEKLRHHGLDSQPFFRLLSGRNDKHATLAGACNAMGGTGLFFYLIVGHFNNISHLLICFSITGMV